ncbi:MAG: helix-turn-helix domain-containing protein [Eubacteriales bacterium]
MEISFFMGNVAIHALRFGFGPILNSVQMHCHSKFSYELHYIVKGEGTLRTNENIFDVKANSLFVTGPNTYHAQTNNALNPMHEFSIYINVDNAKECDVFMKTFLDTHFWIGEGNENISLIFNKIHFEVQRDQFGYTLEISALIQQLIVEIVRLYKPDQFPVHMDYEGGKKDLNDYRLWLIDEAFLNDYKTISIDNLSAQLGICNRQTERLIRKYYGVTFAQKKKDAKMSKAIYLLEKNDLSIFECAVECGYKSFYGFEKAFIAKHGESAVEYREHHKVDEAKAAL